MTLILVVPNGFECLLGLKTIKKLDLITINSEKFIGKIGKYLDDVGHVKLKVDPNASPRALPARNIPLTIREKVKDELEKLTEKGILIPVMEPTEWVHQMAIVRKANGNLHICLDPQPLNKVLVMER